MVASPFEKIEARLAKLEQFLKLQSKLNREAVKVNKSVERHLTERVKRIEHWAEQQMEINLQVKARLDSLLALVETQSEISRPLRAELDEKG